MRSPRRWPALDAPTFGLFFGGHDDDNRNPVFASLILIFAPIAAMLIHPTEERIARLLALVWRRRTA